MMPADITYSIKPKVKLCENFIVDPGFTNTTQFTGPAANDGLRDSHVNDAFRWCCCLGLGSNANIPDKTNNTINVFVTIGKD